MTNKQAFDEAKNFIPGGVDSPVRAFCSVGGEPFVVDRGEGAYLVDVEGKRYLDFIQSWGPLIFGHCDKDIENAVITTAKKGQVFVDMTTSSPTLAEKISNEFLKVGAYALDLPVTGGDVGARNATLSIMAGGDKKVFEEVVLPLVEKLGKNITYFKNILCNRSHYQYYNKCYYRSYSRT